MEANAQKPVRSSCRIRFRAGPFEATKSGIGGTQCRRSRSGRLSFVYDPTWRAARDAYPLSLSMPLVVAEAAVHEVADEARRGGLDHPVIGRLADRLSARAERCARLLTV